MKVAVLLATLFMRLLGAYLLFAGTAGLLAVMPSGFPAKDNFIAVLLVLQVGFGVVAVILAGRVVRLFTADAYLGNE